jgi:hypothetical protein
MGTLTGLADLKALGLFCKVCCELIHSARRGFDAAGEARDDAMKALRGGLVLRACNPRLARVKSRSALALALEAKTAAIC